MPDSKPVALLIQVVTIWLELKREIRQAKKGDSNVESVNKRHHTNAINAQIPENNLQYASFLQRSSVGITSTFVVNTICQVASHRHPSPKMDMNDNVLTVLLVH